MQGDAEAAERVPILGCRVDRVDRGQAMRILTRFCQEDRPHLVVTADASMLVRAQEDRELRQILEEADLVVPDSIGVIWAARLLGTPLPERVAGVEMMDSLCEHCAREGYGVFLLGAAPGVADEAGRQLQRRYPGLKIAGSHHGFFGPDEEPEILERIRASRTDVLFAAMGIPRQEKWLKRNLPSLPVRIGIGVGGSLDVASGRVRRAPVFFQRIHLEWLYRVASDPRRIGKAKTLPVFVVLTLLYRIGQRGKG